MATNSNSYDRAFPNNAVVRNKQNRKWYAVFLRISESKLGLKGDNRIAIIDLALPPEMIDNLVDNEKFFEDYHMNKVIELDDRVNYAYRNYLA